MKCGGNFWTDRMSLTPEQTEWAKLVYGQNGFNFWMDTLDRTSLTRKWTEQIYLLSVQITGMSFPKASIYKFATVKP